MFVVPSAQSVSKFTRAVHPFPATEISTFVIDHVIIVSKPLQNAFFLDVERCSLDGTCVHEFDMTPWRVASWRAGSSLPLRYRNGLSAVSALYL